MRERLCRRGDVRFVGGPFPDAPVLSRTPVRAPETRFWRRGTRRRRGFRNCGCSNAKALGDLLVLGNAIEATEAELQPFVSRYVLDGPDGTGPAPLECAFEKVDGALARSATPATSAYHDMARANALLLLGAAMDGHPVTPALADVAMLPVEPVRGKGRCGATRLPDALAQASVLMADARQAPASSTPRTKRCAACCARRAGSGPAGCWPGFVLD